MNPLARTALFFAMFMGVFDAGAIYLALPPMESDLHAGITDQQWIVGVYLLMQASLTLPMGTLGDLIGRRRVFVTGVTLFVLGSIVCGLSAGPVMIVGARLVQGIGGAVINALSLGMAIAAITDPDERERTVRAFANICGLGAVVAPALGGVLVHFFGWRVLFFVNVPVGIFVVTTVLLLLPRSTRDTTRSIDGLGYLTSFVTLAGLSFAFIEAGTFGWLSPQILTGLALGAGGLAAFIATERRRSDPMLKLSYFCNTVFCGANLAIVTNGLQYFSAFFIASLLLQNVLGLSPLTASVYLTPSMVVFFLVNQFGAKFDKRLGLAQSAMWGTLVCSLALIAFLFFGVSTPPWLVALALIGWCVGAATQYTPAATVAMSQIPERDAGMGSGVVGMSLMFGGILGIGLGGSALTAGVTRGLRAENAPDWLIASSHHGGTWSAVATSSLDAAAKTNLLGVVNRAFIAGMHGSMALIVVLGIAAVVAMAYDFHTKRGSAGALQERLR